MRAEVFEAILRCLPVGVAAADESGRIVFANESARNLLDGRFGRLERMLRRHQSIAFIRCRGTVSQVAARCINGKSVFLIWCPPEPGEHFDSALRELYGLTQKEARLALALFKGQSLSGAAKQAGIELSTARTHLKNIFAKTGTRKQASLAVLMVSCSLAVEFLSDIGKGPGGSSARSAARERVAAVQSVADAR